MYSYKAAVVNTTEYLYKACQNERGIIFKKGLSNRYNPFYRLIYALFHLEQDGLLKYFLKS